MDRIYREGFTQNREISWLRYNERILDEAFDETVPLLERLKYISIFSSNILEFIEVRIGSLISDGENGEDEIDSRSGLSIEEQLDEIKHFIDFLMNKRDTAIARVENELERCGIIRANLVGRNLSPKLSKFEESRFKRFYEENVKDNLKLAFVSENDELPKLKGGKLYFLCKLKSDEGHYYAFASFKRECEDILVLSNGIDDCSDFKFLSYADVARLCLPELCKPFTFVSAYGFLITQNAEIEMLDEDENMLKEMKRLLEERRKAPADQLFIESGADFEIENLILENLRLSTKQICRVGRVHSDYVDQLEQYLPEFRLRDLTYADFEQRDFMSLRTGSVIDAVKREDVLSCYPYDSMDVLIGLLTEASTDDRVKEIRMSIYRLAENSEIAYKLMEAARRGKSVKILIELRARFDEESNIKWAKALKKAGCKVYFGDKKYKVHAKLLQLVLEENGKISYISQVSTGNFNENTAHSYTDIALTTSHYELGRELSEFFTDTIKHRLTSYEHILTSPNNMGEKIIELIRREAEKGDEGRIFLKLNSLSDERIIEELMEASCKGCKIRLIVRGICCLLPNVDFCTENITIVNLVGRFLEHSRVYVFGTGKDEIMYISSADMMNRNLDKRVELACPVYDSKLRSRIRAMLYLNFMDNVKGRVMRSDGVYAMKPRSVRITDSQQQLIL